MSLYEAALDYALRGIPVFPVAAGGKVPLTPRGFLDATTETATVTNWWTRWPKAGIGVPTGPKSGWLVIDVDPRHDGHTTLAAYEAANGRLPITLTSRTGGGGRHLVYRYPTDGTTVKSSANVKVFGGKGVDTRAAGGYVVVAPSDHASGTPYAWEEAEADIEELPEALLAALARPPELITRPNELVNGTKIPDGERNIGLTRVAGKLRRAGLTTDGIFEALKADNVNLCVTPLPEGELRVIARSIGGREGDPVWTETDAGIALVSYSADDIGKMQLPPRDYILAPVFQEKNMAMIVAERGVGKTLVGIGWGLAIANGDNARFLRWVANQSRRVLYIDGELPVETLQKRLRDVAASASLPLSANLKIVTPDLQPAYGAMPNLAEPKAQERILEVIEREQPEVVFFDNLSTLVRGGEENLAEDWQPVQDFLVHLRSRRISSVLLHHKGKSGSQRGTSKREDVLDLTVELNRPEGYTADQGARFEVTYTKSRDPHGDAVRPFEAWLRQGDGFPHWDVTVSGANRRAEVQEKVLAVLPAGVENRISGRRVTELAEVRAADATPALEALRQRGLAASEPLDGRSGGGGAGWYRT